MSSENKLPFKVKDVTRMIKKAIVAGSLEELRSKVSEKFEHYEQQPRIHLDSDGTEIDDEEYFRTLDANAELIAVFNGEHWIDPSNYVSMTNREDLDTIDSTSESARIRKLVGELQQNLCNISMMNDSDLETLSNMDPNSLVDITGKDLMEQMKDAGRPLCAKRNAADRVNLLKLLKDGAIFCSESYPEEAEAIDQEINNDDKTTTARNNTQGGTAATTTTTATNRRTVIIENIINTKTIEHFQNANANANANINTNTNTNMNSTSNLNAIYSNDHHHYHQHNHHDVYNCQMQRDFIDSNSNSSTVTSSTAATTTATTTANTMHIIPTIILTTPSQQQNLTNLNTNSNDI